MKKIHKLVSFLLLTLSLTSCGNVDKDNKSDYSYTPPIIESEVTPVSFSFPSSAENICSLWEFSRSSTFYNQTSKSIIEAIIKDEYFYKKVKVEEIEYNELTDESLRPKEGYFKKEKSYIFERDNEKYSIYTPQDTYVEENNLSYSKNKEDVLETKEEKSKKSYSLSMSSDYKYEIERYTDSETNKVETKKSLLNESLYYDKLNLINTSSFIDLFDNELKNSENDDSLSLKNETLNENIKNKVLYYPSIKVDDPKSQYVGEYTFSFSFNVGDENDYISCQTSWHVEFCIGGLKKQSFEKKMFYSKNGVLIKYPFYTKTISLTVLSFD